MAIYVLFFLSLFIKTIHTMRSANTTKTTEELLSFPLPDLELIKVEAGSFIMGDDESSSGREKPAHPVQIKNLFYLGKFQVTQGLYEAVMKKNPSYFQGASRPVEKVSWDDAKLFIAALEEMEAVKDFKKEHKLLGYKFRLPTESEWEYAARGGLNSQGYEYCGSDDLKQVGWYNDNSGVETKPVGLLLPNELGLYDMSGNVFEWCEDDYHGNYKEAPDDGSAWVDGTTAADRATYRVLRGGSYFFSAGFCRPARRGHHSPGGRYDFIGFRLVFSLQS
jgi:formylglycine-generating enzyme required for sulfatase activity